MIKSREESKLNRKEKVAKRNSEIKEKLHIKRRMKNERIREGRGNRDIGRSSGGSSLLWDRAAYRLVLNRGGEWI